MAEQRTLAGLSEAPPSTDNRFTALQHELESRSRQQTAVAELGQAALTGIDAPLLTGQACALVLDTLNCDFVRMLEYVPARQHLVVRASVGYSGPFEPSEADSEAIYTFLSNHPVDFEDLSQEVRFAPAAVLKQAGIVSGMSVPLTSPDGPFGVIGAYSKEPRRFRTYEIEFLQSIANVLSAAIARHQALEDLEKSRAALAESEKLAGIGSWSWSRGIRQWIWSDGLYALFGSSRDDGESTYESFLRQVHPGDRAAFSFALDCAFTEAGSHQIDHRLVLSDGSVRAVRSTIETIFGANGRPLRVIGATFDRTPMAQAQEQQVRLAALIELSAKEWRMACDAIDAVLLVTDASGTILRLNEYARMRLGVPFTEAVGSSLPAREPWIRMQQLATVAVETHLDAFDTWTEPEYGGTLQITARALTDAPEGQERIVIVARHS